MSDYVVVAPVVRAESTVSHFVSVPSNGTTALAAVTTGRIFPRGSR